MKTALRSTIFVLGLFGLSVAAHAQTFTYWTGAGADATAFNASDNWGSGAPDNSGTFAQIAAINNGTVTISGGATADVVFVGNEGGTATLNLGSGSSLSLNYLSFGVEEGSSGTGTISNGASVTASSTVAVGDGNFFGPGLTTGTTGSLTISSGGTVNGSIAVANAVLATGTVTVTGSGSTVTGGINGADGTAHITVQNSALVQGGVFVASGTSDITVNSGATIEDGIGAGGNASGTSSFTVSGGATLTGGSIAVNASTGGTATGTITGGTHTNLGSIFLGGGGTNQLTVSGGASLGASGTSSLSHIGRTSGDTSTFTLTGSGTSWTNGGTLDIGDTGGTGTFNVSSGASTTQAGAVNVGVNTGGSGTLNVTGASTFTASDALSIGTTTGSGGGTGTLLVSGGSTVTSNTSTIAGGSGSSGTVTVTGAGSSWTVGNSFTIGSGGTANVTVSSGGALVSNGSGVTVGGSNGTNASVTVTGSGSSWSNAGNLYVGNQNGATGSVTLANGGNLNLGSGILFLSNASTATGTLNIGAAANQAAAAPGTLTFTTPASGTTPTSGVVRSLAGTGTLVFNHTSNSYMFAPVMDGNVNLLQKAGTTILTGGTNTILADTGSTTISGGTLRLGVNQAFGSGALAMSGGTLDLANYTQTAGVLTLNGNSYIDFGSLSSSLILADSSGSSWTGTLTVTNFTNGVDFFRVGTDTNGLLAIGQLDHISIDGFTALIDGGGYLTKSAISAIPEPSTCAALAGLVALGLAAYRRRARLEIQAEQQL